MPAPRKSRTITFSLPPEMAEQVRTVMREEGRTMSELLREALRLYMEERRRRLPSPGHAPTSSGPCSPHP